MAYILPNLSGEKANLLASLPEKVKHGWIWGLKPCSRGSVLPSALWALFCLAGTLFRGAIPVRWLDGSWQLQASPDLISAGSLLPHVLTVAQGLSRAHS